MLSCRTSFPRISFPFLRIKAIRLLSIRFGHQAGPHKNDRARTIQIVAILFGFLVLALPLWYTQPFGAISNGADDNAAIFPEYTLVSSCRRLVSESFYYAFLAV